MSPVEITINVPWGHIAGTAWGSSTNPIVLLFHGLLDNAASFDHLIPLLPVEYYYVSIDLPGHGKSSHISPGLTLQAIDYIYVLKIIVDHFNREKNILIGHSFGSILAVQYGLIYPEKVEVLFALDTLWFKLVEPKQFTGWMRKSLDALRKENGRISSNSDLKVTYSQAVDMFGAYRYPNCELTPQATETLLKRSLVECGSGLYRFTRDLRLRHYMGYPIDERYVEELLTSSKFGCKAVLILTKFNDNKYREEHPTAYAALKRCGELYVVNGTHHVHLNQPEIVAPIISSFLEDNSFPV